MHINERKPKSAEVKRAARQLRRSPVGSGRFTAAELRAKGEAQGWRCHWCGADCKENYHVDHIQPLSKGGSNRIENICIACPTCNLKKGASLPGEMKPPRRRKFVTSDEDFGF